MINTISKNNVEEEKVYFMSVAPVCPEERLQQEQRAGTWRQNVEQSACRTLSWLASPVCSALTVQAPAYGWYCPQWAEPSHQLVIKETPNSKTQRSV